MYSLTSPLFIITWNFAPCNISFVLLSCFTICKLYEPVFFSFGTVTVISPSLMFTVLPFACVSSEKSTSLAMYAPPFMVFVTFNINVSINLLYPAGASVSVIVIVSAPVSVIVIGDIVILPFSFKICLYPKKSIPFFTMPI